MGPLGFVDILGDCLEVGEGFGHLVPQDVDAPQQTRLDSGSFGSKGFRSE